MRSDAHSSSRVRPFPFVMKMEPQKRKKELPKQTGGTQEKGGVFRSVKSANQACSLGRFDFREALSRQPPQGETGETNKHAVGLCSVMRTCGVRTR